MFDTALLAMMGQRPKLLPEATVGQYGKRAYGAPVTMTALWVQGGSTAESSGGASAHGSGTLYIAPPEYWDTPYTRPPTVDDGLQLPDGSRPTISKVTVYRTGDDKVFGIELEYGG